MLKNRFLISVLFIILNNSYPQSSLNLKNDNVQLKEDESITISVLKNDNIKDKSNLIIELSEKPQNGDVEIQGEQLTYTPNENFNGVDKFSYKVDRSKSFCDCFFSFFLFYFSISFDWLINKH